MTGVSQSKMSKMRSRIPLASAFLRRGSAPGVVSNAQIDPGAERVTRTREHDHPDVLVGVGITPQALEIPRDPPIDRVLFLWVGDGGGEHWTVAVEPDVLVAFEVDVGHSANIPAGRSGVHRADFPVAEQVSRPNPTGTPVPGPSVARQSGLLRFARR